jgi:hypothetical protein
MKGSCRGLIWNTSPVFILKDWGKSRKTLGQPAQNWTQDPPNRWNATLTRDVAEIFNTGRKQLNCLKL